VSTARWNLKEAAGKALARRTENAYEACKLDEGANIFKVQYLYGKLARRCGGYKREGECALPGEICQLVLNYCHREVMGRVGRSQPRAY
jgi:hypothetical protein